MRLDHASEPATESCARRLGVGGVGLAAKERTHDRIAEHREPGEQNDEEGVLVRRRRHTALGVTNLAKLVRRARDRVEAATVFLARRVAGEREPRDYARMSAGAERARDTLEQAVDRVVVAARANRELGEQIALERTDAALDHRLNEGLATAEVMQHGWVRDADLGGHVVQADARRSDRLEALLCRVEDGGSRIRRRPSNPCFTSDPSFAHVAHPRMLAFC